MERRREVLGGETEEVRTLIVDITCKSMIVTESIGRESACLSYQSVFALRPHLWSVDGVVVVYGCNHGSTTRTVPAVLRLQCISELTLSPVTLYNGLAPEVTPTKHAMTCLLVGGGNSGARPGPPPHRLKSKSGCEPSDRRVACS